jgi:transmembrane sensor
LNAQSRDIRLVKGEALFEVARDPDRPFRVYAGNGLVRAIGTTFTVYLKDSDNVSVTVAEGEVELATVSVPDVKQRAGDTADVPAAPLAKIKAGQIATFSLDIESIQTLEHAELSRRLSWRDGMLRFDGEPLSEAVQEVSRYTTQKIVILDPALRDLRIGGYFRVGETEAMFEALESSFGVRVERINESLVHLSARR